MLGRGRGSRWRGTSNGRVGPDPGAGWRRGERRRETEARAAKGEARPVGETSAVLMATGTVLQTVSVPAEKSEKSELWAPRGVREAEPQAHPNRAHAQQKPNPQKRPPAPAPMRGRSMGGEESFVLFSKGRGGSERSESKMFRLQSQRCKGPEVGARLRCWTQSEECSVAGAGGRGSRITPEGTG